MELPDPNHVPGLVTFTDNQLDTHSAFDVLSNVREEAAWLANFSSDNTRRRYQHSVASFIATLGITAPDDLYAVKQAHILAWRSSMEAAGLSPATIANQLSSVSSLYRHLADKQLVPANPCAGVRRPKTGNAGIGAGKSPTLSKRQVRAFLDAPDIKTLQGLRDRALLHVFFYTGARCSEPAQLRVRDFSYDAEFPILSLTIKGGKTNTVAINLECAKAIREYLDAAPHSDDPSAYLFQHVKNARPGSPLSRDQFYHLFKRYASKAGIEVPLDL